MFSGYNGLVEPHVVDLLRELVAGQRRIEAILTNGAKIMSQTSDAVAALQAEQAKQTTLIQTAVTTLQSIAGGTTDADTAAKINAVVAAMQGDDSALAAAESPPASPPSST